MKQKKGKNKMEISEKNNKIQHHDARPIPVE
jgi:hypothetical protein